MTTTVTAEGVAQLFRDHVWKLHGLPEKVLSDWVHSLPRGDAGAEPDAGYQNSNLNSLPPADGQSDGTHQQEIEQYLRLFVEHRQSDWMNWLPMAEFSYNNRMQPRRRICHHAELGQHPRMGIVPHTTTKVDSVENCPMISSSCPRCQRDAVVLSAMSC